VARQAYAEKHSTPGGLDGHAGDSTRRDVAGSAGIARCAGFLSRRRETRRVDTSAPVGASAPQHLPPEREPQREEHDHSGEEQERLPFDPRQLAPRCRTPVECHPSSSFAIAAGRLSRSALRFAGHYGVAVITNGDVPPPPAAETRLQRLRRSPATSVLLIALVAIFFLTAADPELVGRFAKVDSRIRAGEWWRLFTASFLHGGLLHLGVNALALSAIGPTVEQLYGRVRFALIFLFGGALGFAASTLFVRSPSLGASAGLFALLGVLLGYAVRQRRAIAPSARRAMIREILMVAGLNLAFGFAVQFVDNAAHVGGFVGGLALGMVLRPIRRRSVNALVHDAS